MMYKLIIQLSLHFGFVDRLFVTYFIACTLYVYFCCLGQ